MATYTSALVDKANSFTDASSGMVNGDDLNGNVLVATASYTLLGTETSGQTIQVTPNLPAGSVVVPSLCSVDCDDPGTTLTIDVGDSTDADRYADGIALAAGGNIPFTGGVSAVTPYRPSTGQAIIADIKAVSSLTADAVLTFNVVYRGKA